MTKLCSIDGCQSRLKAKGYCQRHYLRNLKTGSPTGTLRRNTEDRFYSKVKKTDGCWLWLTGKNENGYGLFFGNDRHWLAHRFAYELHYGPIPAGMVLDHSCRTPSCVNPGHLRACSQKQNSENLATERKNNKSGVRGVSWFAPTRRWRAAVQHNGKQFHLGYFHDLALAEAAAIAKRKELFTHNIIDRIPA